MKWWDVRLIFFFPCPRPPVGCYTEMNILSCQEDKVMRLVPFLSPSFFFHPCLSEADGLVYGSKKSSFIVIGENILCWSQKHLLFCVG